MDMLKVFIGRWQMLLPTGFLNGIVDFLRTHFVINIAFNMMNEVWLIKTIKICNPGCFWLVCFLSPSSISIAFDKWHKIFNILIDNWLSGFTSDIFSGTVLGIEASTEYQGGLHSFVAHETCVLITSKTSRNTGSFTLSFWTGKGPSIIAGLRPLGIPSSLESPMISFYFIQVFLEILLLRIVHALYRRSRSHLKDLSKINFSIGPTMLRSCLRPLFEIICCIIITWIYGTI